MHLKTSSAKRLPFCLSLHVLRYVLAPCSMQSGEAVLMVYWPDSLPLGQVPRVRSLTEKETSLLTLDIHCFLLWPKIIITHH